MLTPKRLKEELYQTLLEYTDPYFKPRWGVYVKGKLLSISNKETYATEGIARKKAMESLVGRRCTKAQREMAKQALEELVAEGKVEFKIVG
jgi:hypothetical protein